MRDMKQEYNDYIIELVRFEGGPIAAMEEREPFDMWLSDVQETEYWDDLCATRDAMDLIDEAYHDLRDRDEPERTTEVTHAQMAYIRKLMGRPFHTGMAIRNGLYETPFRTIITYIDGVSDGGHSLFVYGEWVFSIAEGRRQ